MIKSNATKALIISCLLQLSCAASAEEIKNVSEYQVIEIKEGEFRPKNKDGTPGDKKYSAYFLSVEGDDDNESHTRANYSYFGIKAGIALPTNLNGNSQLSGQSGDATSSYSAFVGKKFMDIFSVEIEYMRRGKSTITNSVENVDVPGKYSWSAKSNAFMLNVSADITKGRVIRPYIKAGVGVARNDANNFIITSNSDTQTYKGKTTTNFTWQVGMGMNVVLNRNIDIMLEYMYVDRGKIKTEAGYNSAGFFNPVPAKTGKLKDNIITVGLKIKL